MTSKAIKHVKGFLGVGRDQQQFADFPLIFGNHSMPTSIVE